MPDGDDPPGDAPVPVKVAVSELTDFPEFFAEGWYCEEFVYKSGKHKGQKYTRFTSPMGKKQVLSLRHAVRIDAQERNADEDEAVSHWDQRQLSEERNRREREARREQREQERRLGEEVAAMAFRRRYGPLLPEVVAALKGWKERRKPHTGYVCLGPDRQEFNSLEEVESFFGRRLKDDGGCPEIDAAFKQVQTGKQMFRVRPAATEEPRQPQHRRRGPPCSPPSAFKRLRRKGGGSPPSGPPEARPPPARPPAGGDGAPPPGGEPDAAAAPAAAPGVKRRRLKKGPGAEHPGGAAAPPGEAAHGAGDGDGGAEDGDEPDPAPAAEPTAPEQDAGAQPEEPAAPRRAVAAEAAPGRAGPEPAAGPGGAPAAEAAAEAAAAAEPGAAAAAEAAGPGAAAMEMDAGPAQEAAAAPAAAAAASAAPAAEASAPAAAPAAAAEEAAAPAGGAAALQGAARAAEAPSPAAGSAGEAAPERPGSCTVDLVSPAGAKGKPAPADRRARIGHEAKRPRIAGSKFGPGPGKEETVRPRGAACRPPPGGPPAGAAPADEEAPPAKKQSVAKMLFGARATPGPGAAAPAAAAPPPGAAASEADAQQSGRDRAKQKDGASQVVVVDADWPGEESNTPPRQQGATRARPDARDHSSAKGPRPAGKASGSARQAAGRAKAKAHPSQPGHCHAEERETGMWHLRCLPTKLNDLRPKPVWQQLRKWLLEWQTCKRGGAYGAALITGPTGCGKTIGARMTAESAKGHYLEYDLDEKAGRSFLDTLARRQTTCEGSVVIMHIPDEAMASVEDRICAAARATPMPLILLGSEEVLKMESVTSVCLHLPVQLNVCLHRILQRVTEVEGVKGAEKGVTSIAKAARGDLRRALNAAQLLGARPELLAADLLPPWAAVSQAGAVEQLLASGSACPHGGDPEASGERLSGRLRLLALDEGGRLPLELHRAYLRSGGREDSRSLEALAEASAALVAHDVATATADRVAWASGPLEVCATADALLLPVCAAARCPADPEERHDEAGAMTAELSARYAAELGLPKSWVLQQVVVWSQSCSFLTAGRFRWWVRDKANREFARQGKKLNPTAKDFDDLDQGLDELPPEASEEATRQWRLRQLQKSTVITKTELMALAYIELRWLGQLDKPPLPHPDSMQGWFQGQGLIFEHRSGHFDHHLRDAESRPNFPSRVDARWRWETTLDLDPVLDLIRAKFFRVCATTDPDDAALEVEGDGEEFGIEEGEEVAAVESEEDEDAREECDEGAEHEGECSGAAAASGAGARRRLVADRKGKVKRKADAKRRAEPEPNAEPKRNAEAERKAEPEPAAEAERKAEAEHKAEAEPMAQAVRKAEPKRKAHVERKAEPKRKAHVERKAEAKRKAGTEQKADAERKVDAERKPEAEGKAEAERKAEVRSLPARGCSSDESDDDAPEIS